MSLWKHAGLPVRGDTASPAYCSSKDLEISKAGDPKEGCNLASRITLAQLPVSSISVSMICICLVRNTERCKCQSGILLK